jgi:hypothetical protein
MSQAIIVKEESIIKEGIVKEGIDKEDIDKEDIDKEECIVKEGIDNEYIDKEEGVVKEDIVKEDIDKEGIHPSILYIYESYNRFKSNSAKSFDIEVPVQKIDDIEVEIFLRFSLYRIDCNLCVYSYIIYDEGNNLTMYFNKNLLDIHSNSSSHEDDKPIEYTIDNITEIYNNCNAILSKLQFDRLHGKMYKNDIDAKGVQFGLIKLKGLESWTNDVGIFDNIETMYKQCQVCFEITKTRTNCKHPLCIVCWEKICWTNPLVDNQICPTCAKELNNHDHVFDRIFREESSEGDNSESGNYEDGSDGEDENFKS